MSAEQVMCMASGSVGGVHKYYFFAQELATALFPPCAFILF